MEGTILVLINLQPFILPIIFHLQNLILWGIIIHPPLSYTLIPDYSYIICIEQGFRVRDKSVRDKLANFLLIFCRHKQLKFHTNMTDIKLKDFMTIIVSIKYLLYNDNIEIYMQESYIGMTNLFQFLDFGGLHS